MGKWYKEMLKYMRWAEGELQYMIREELKKAVAKVIDKEQKNRVDRRSVNIENL